MSLRAQAAADARTILEDAVTGFGVAITLTSPEGVIAVLTGHATDISQTLDPETGQAVAGRQASIAVPISALTAAGLDLPKHVASAKQRPWVVEFPDVNGNVQKWKVREAMPDREIGLTVCMLEFWRV